MATLLLMVIFLKNKEVCKQAISNFSSTLDAQKMFALIFHLKFKASFILVLFSCAWFYKFVSFKFFFCFLFLVFLFYFPYCSFFFPLLPFSFSFLLLLFAHLHHHFLLRASTLPSCFAHPLFLPTYPIHHSTYSLLCLPIVYSSFHYACSPLYLFIMFCMLATFCLLVI